MSIVWILISVGIAILVQGLLVGVFGLKKVSYERRFSQRSAYEGEQVNLVEVIRNRKLLPVPWIRVESRISPNLRFRGAKSEERAINADRYHIIGTCAFYTARQLKERYKVIQEDEA